jgi:hypothetical protein
MGLLSRNGGLLATPNLAIHPLPNPTVSASPDLLVGEV